MSNRTLQSAAELDWRSRDRQTDRQTDRYHQQQSLTRTHYDCDS